MLRQTPQIDEERPCRSFDADEKYDDDDDVENREELKMGPFTENTNEAIYSLVESRPLAKGNTSGEMAHPIGEVGTCTSHEGSQDLTTFEKMVQEDDSRSSSVEIREKGNYLISILKAAEGPRKKRGRHDFENSTSLGSGENVRLPKQKRPRKSQRNSDALVKLEKDDESTPKMMVRPTYQGIGHDFVEDNEADDIIVMSVKDWQTEVCAEGLPKPSWTPRPWETKEEEELRCWVQDYGITEWESIAWVKVR
ncbi:hypothetical protein P7C71_g2062, partial [Lecanoromycetidae sp. Uapishka_2]